MRSRLLLKKTVILITALSTCIMYIILAGCQLPAVSLYQPGEPSDDLLETIETLNRSDEKGINELLYNCTWSLDADAPMSETERMIADALAQSRSIVIKKTTYPDADDRVAELSVSLTVFDMVSFEEKLTQTIEADVKQQMYEGVEITDTNAIIESNMRKLLENPKPFYRTSDYSVEMILSKGKWRLALTDEFYSALLGTHDDDASQKRSSHEK